MLPVSLDNAAVLKLDSNYPIFIYGNYRRCPGNRYAL